MRHRKHNYVVGFSGENQIAYGQDIEDPRYTEKVASYTELMTKGEAEEVAKRLASVGNSKRYVFKLVPVLCID